jgi:RND family efflux transporter MFP subunit
VTRRFGTLLLLAVAIAVVALVWRTVASRNASVPETSAQPQIPVAVARIGSVEETLSLSGRVGPPAGTQLKLSFGLPGTVQSVDVRLGQRVERGAPLAQLDATSYTLAAQQATADAQAAAAATASARVDRFSVKLRADEAELQRQRQLLNAGIMAVRDVQAAQAALAGDRADALSAREQLAQAQAQSRSASARAASAGYDVARTVLRAPASGTVAGIFVQAGQLVDPTTPVLALASSQDGLATLDAPVGDLPRIAPGNPVRLRSGGGSWKGSVEGVAPAVDPATGLAVVSVTGVPPGVAPGTPIDATVVVGRARGLVIPRSAVIEDPQSGAQLVFVQSGDEHGALRFAARQVTIDVKSADLVRVRSGLRAGERVASQGAIDLLAPPAGS